MTSVGQLDLSAIRVLDGGMATELEKLGCDLSGPLWSAHVLREEPAKVEAVHDSYLEAGADCILTASYQVSVEAYAEIGLSAEDAAAGLRDAVRLAENSRARFALRSARKAPIAASLGPYGAALHNGAEYHGNYGISPEELIGFHARRIAVLAATNADLIAFETVPSLEEARAIAAALEGFPEIAAWVSFTCRDGERVAHGELISECAGFLDAVPQIVAVGINCTAPGLVASLVRRARVGTRSGAAGRGSRMRTASARWRRSGATRGRRSLEDAAGPGRSMWRASAGLWFRPRLRLRRELGWRGRRDCLPASHATIMTPL